MRSLPSSAELEVSAGVNGQFCKAGTTQLRLQPASCYCRGKDLRLHASAVAICRVAWAWKEVTQLEEGRPQATPRH